MKIILNKENLKDPKMIQDVISETLTELLEKDERVALVNADIASGLGGTGLIKKYPKRVIDCGIAEANMLGVAAGMAAVGFIPFIHTFGCFATRRIYDQIFISGAYSKSNIKIFGSDPGISAQYNGGTHMPFEDIALMRAIPEMTVIDVTDGVMMRDILYQIKDIYGMFYFRAIRKSVPKIYNEGSTFDIGKAVTLRDGKDITIIAEGYCVAEALKASKILAEENISARVLDMFTIKPIDKDAIIKATKDTGAIVTAENHNIIGGLGSAVAEVIVENNPVPMERIGVNDMFGEVGDLAYLSDKFELNAKHIAAKCRKAIARK